MIWRCRLDSDTMSSSTTPSVPTPAAARYISAGAPSPPAPITSTDGLLQRGLAGAADLAQHDMAGVAFEFFGTQHVGRCPSLCRSVNHRFLNPRPVVADQADVLNCAHVNDHPRFVMRSMLTATLIFVAAAASAQAQIRPPSTAGAKPKPVATVPVRPGAADPGRYRQCDGAGRTAGAAVGPRLGRPV